MNNKKSSINAFALAFKKVKPVVPKKKPRKFEPELTKKDWQKIERYIKLRGPDYFTKKAIKEDLIDGLQAIALERRKLIQAKKISLSEIGLTITCAMKPFGWRFLDYSLYQRLKANKPGGLLNGLYTSQRINFLANKYSKYGYSSGDCYHVHDLFISLAGDDEALSQAYITQIPGPFKKAHPFAVTLANTLYAILQDQQNKYEEISKKIKTRISVKSTPKYDRAILLALDAIMKKNPKALLEHLEDVLYYHSRNDLYAFVGLDQFICLPAHALYNLACKKWKKHPKEPIHKYWDTKYNRYVRNLKRSPKHLLDLASVSPMLAKLVDELPEEPDLIAFARSLDHLVTD